MKGIEKRLVVNVSLRSRALFNLASHVRGFAHEGPKFFKGQMNRGWSELKTNATVWAASN